MASQCEVLVDTEDPIVFENFFAQVKTEALRLEGKYSRYSNDNIVYKINNSKGKKIQLDEETASLIDFSFQCYKMSEGLFDITSGVLRKIWNFKEFKNFPTEKEIKDSLKKVGMSRLIWKNSALQMESGMEIDFGGIVKEYAVDRCVGLFTKNSPAALINFGGDISVSAAPRSGSWAVAIEELFNAGDTRSKMNLRNGAIATSGDTHRFFEHKGKRYSHILNPKTGHPVCNGAATITVHAETCTLAGVLATISHLQEKPAAFLEQQEVQHWITRYKK
jgi:FAD:protein FMN transferase